MPKQQETETNNELPKGLMLRLPPDLHVAVRQLAEDERRSLNSQLIILVELGLQQLGKFPDPDDLTNRPIDRFGNPPYGEHPKRG
jgi:hypothetical protein